MNIINSTKGYGKQVKTNYSGQKFFFPFWKRKFRAFFSNRPEILEHFLGSKFVHTKFVPPPPVFNWSSHLNGGYDRIGLGSIYTF